MADKKETQALVAAARTWKGWRVKDIANGWTLYPPDKNIPGITIHKTPSDWRVWNNTLTRLRRAGAPV